MTKPVKQVVQELGSDLRMDGRVGYLYLGDAVCDAFKVKCPDCGAIADLIDMGIREPSFGEKFDKQAHCDRCGRVWSIPMEVLIQVVATSDSLIGGVSLPSELSEGLVAFIKDIQYLQRKFTVGENECPHFTDWEKVRPRHLTAMTRMGAFSGLGDYDHLRVYMLDLMRDLEYLIDIGARDPDDWGAIASDIRDSLKNMLEWAKWKLRQNEAMMGAFPDAPMPLERAQIALQEFLQGYYYNHDKTFAVGLAGARSLLVYVQDEDHKADLEKFLTGGQSIFGTTVEIKVMDRLEIDATED